MYIFPPSTKCVCTAIKIGESDFCVEFDQDKVWIALGKWSGSQTPENL